MANEETCPYCSGVVAPTDQTCPHCHGTAQTVRLRSKLTAKTALLVAIATFVLVGLVIGNMDRPASPPHMVKNSRTSEAPPPLPTLALLSSRGGESSSAYYRVEGEVLNIGPHPLPQVVAVATWYDKNDAFISSDTGLVEYDPLMPGQKSPFKVLIRANPLMHSYVVGFKAIGGAEYVVEDRRKPKKGK